MSQLGPTEAKLMIGVVIWGCISIPLCIWLARYLPKGAEWPSDPVKHRVKCPQKKKANSCGQSEQHQAH